MIRSTPSLILLCFLVCTFVSQPTRAANTMRLDGNWHFEFAPLDPGVQPQWVGRPLRAYIKLPGILQSQFFYGNDITTETPWVLSPYDRYRPKTPLSFDFQHNNQGSRWS